MKKVKHLVTRSCFGIMCEQMKSSYDEPGECKRFRAQSATDTSEATVQVVESSSIKISGQRTPCIQLASCLEGNQNCTNSKSELF